MDPRLLSRRSGGDVSDDEDGGAAQNGGAGGVNPGDMLADAAMQMHVNGFVVQPVPPGGAGGNAEWAAALEAGLNPLHLEGQFA